MPNGNYHPTCLNCNFLDDAMGKKICKTNEFVMPRIGEVICRQWQLHEKYRSDNFHYDYVADFMKSEEFQSLKYGFLYYYSYTSAAPFENIASFKALRNLLFATGIEKIIELGWCLCPIKINPLWLEAETKLELILGQISYEFYVVNSERLLPKEIGPKMPDGKLKYTYRTEMHRVIYCPEFPNILYDWLNEYLDVEGYMSEWLEKGYDFISIPSIVEEIHIKKTYRLYPYLLEYGKHRRTECNHTMPTLES